MNEESITLFSNGKINLGLIIKGKRPDGYHLLETVYCPVYAYQDRIDIQKDIHGTCRLSVEGLDIPGNPSENLCVKAFEIMKENYPFISGINVKLKKSIPMGAGLGGGSSNAAFILRGINNLFQLGLKRIELAEFGASLGADVPFFLFNYPMFAQGIGTELEPISLEWNFKIKVVPSPIHSSTVAAYKNLELKSLDLTRDLRSILSAPVSTWKEELPNDLEGPVFEEFPELKASKEKLYEEGAVYAAMSGSGSAVYGLFERS